MRRGYLLTALSALLLLAASVGTAEAQDVLSDVEIELEAPQTVGEGGDLTVTVRGSAMVATTPEGGDVATNRIVTVELALAAGTAIPGFTQGEFGTAGQTNDAAIVSNPRVSLVFAENTGSEPRKRTASATVSVRVNDDADAEHERVRIGLDTSDGTGIGVPGNVTEPTIAAVEFGILDSDTQTYVLTLDDETHHRTNPPIENGPITVNIEAVPRHFQGGNVLQLQLSQDGGRASGYSASGADSTGPNVAIGTSNPAGGDPLGAAVNTRDITISQRHEESSDGNRVPDTITLEAHAGPAGRDALADSLDITVLDIHGLPAGDAITAKAMDEDGSEVMEIVEGGDSVYLTLTLDRGRGAQELITTEELTVDIRPANSAQVADYDLTETRVVFEERSSGKQTNDVDLEIMLSARNDEDVGDEELELSLVLSGDSDVGTETSTGTFTIAIVDDTMQKVWPLQEEEAYPALMDAMEAGGGDEGLNPGESFMVMTDDLFGVADGYTASYGVSVEGEGVSVSASSDHVTVTAESAGESTVTVTATAKMTSSSFKADQTVSDVAHITFPVTVVDKMLMLTIEMPDNAMEGNVVEGMSYHIPVMTNRAVHEDTDVTFVQRGGAENAASEDDYSIGDVTIMAGEMEAMAELMITEDMMDDAGHAMGEQLVIYAMAGDVESDDLTFTIWDEAVPALPLIAQLLLALFLMAGGARLYRRRQS